jgi:hypothetical protein
LTRRRFVRRAGVVAGLGALTWGLTDALAACGEGSGPEAVEVPVERLVGAALDRLGAVDLLVDNAGGQLYAPAEAISPERLARGAPAGRRGGVDRHPGGRDPLDGPEPTGRGRRRARAGRPGGLPAVVKAMGIEHKSNAGGVVRGGWPTPVARAPR